jgi:hypothetical protein
LAQMIFSKRCMFCSIQPHTLYNLFKWYVWTNLS